MHGLASPDVCSRTADSGSAFSLRIRDEAVPRANPGEEQDRHGGSEWAERARNRNASTTTFQLLPLPSMGPRNLPPHCLFRGDA